MNCKRCGNYISNPSEPCSVCGEINNIETNTKKWYEIPNGITIDTIDPFSGEERINGYACFYEKGSEPSYNYLEYFEKISK